MDSSAQDRPYWTRESDELINAFGSGAGGLTAAQAKERLAQLGANSIEDTARTGAVRLLLRQFESPLVLILVFAAAVSMLLQQWVDAAIVVAIVLGSSLLGFYQENRASQAVEALKRRLALTCRVVREGVEQVVPVASVVPGDIVLLSAGNLIPADGLVLDAADFLVSEAAMTGESFPVEKRPGMVAADAPISARTNAVFLGASVRSGTARVLAVKTGRQSEFGAIAARLRGRPEETDFARGVRRFGYLLIRVMVLIVLFVLTVNLLLDRPVAESLLFAVALAVGLSPELLPAIITVTLSAGAKAMSERGVIVRRLEAIENLGSMDVFCTDKTGTLTEGTVVLHDAVDADGRHSDEVLQFAFLNASFETGIENPIDAAVIAKGEATNLTISGYSKIDEIPYDFTRRLLTIVVEVSGDPSQRLIITKGAFDNVLMACTSVSRGGATVELDENLREELARFPMARGAKGYRVLAIATREAGVKSDYTRDDEAGMTLRGFLVFEDPPKAEAKKTISDLAALGIGIKVISGDNRFVTAHIAQVVGLNPAGILTGDEIAKLNDEALYNLAARTDLFVEVDPQQKERIIRALQRTGHSVGYLGDGINDAPALHVADVGISVEQAVDVARESADIILLNRDLDVLRSGIEEGRRTFANTLKYISITTSANFGNMVSMALATPLLPYLPLSAKQILLNNFLSDMPSIAISSDNADPEQIATPQRWSIRDIQRFMVVFGLISSCFDIVTFATLLFVFHASETTFQTSWFMISLLTELGVVLVLRTRKPAWRSRPSSLLFWSTIVVSSATLTIPYLGTLAEVFDFVPLSAMQMGTAILIIAAYLAATEIAKQRLFRPRTKQ
ncbi:magnesium-translocating P-type ATPase [Ciceribacter azotifigens]|uniref:magnesium-translocating P-type ATPase n=1 Tax=Ciceribacter azotifigens TaxID=2069303 RepID=UPI003A83E548